MNSLVYITGIWFYLWVVGSKIILGNQIEKKDFLLRYLLIGYPVVVVTTYLLRYKKQLKTLSLKSYNFDESERYLQNLEDLVEAYKISA